MPLSSASPSPRDGGLLAVPKVELHAHLEGTASPALMRRIAERNGLPFPSGVMGTDDNYTSNNFLHFLDQYDKVANLIRTEADYRDITYEYLTHCAAQGAIYVELIASPDHANQAGLTDEQHLAGIVQGIDDARAATGIEARIVMTCVRQFGVDQAIKVAQRVTALPHPYVTGFGIAGDEAGFPPQQFAEAFEIAANAGLGITAHAGEWSGPDSVLGALTLPSISRLGHGVRAIEDPTVVEALVAREITLECCPTSNVILGIYRDYDSHPFRALKEAGVKLTLNSDDPPWFGASVAGEYAIALEHFDLDAAGLRALSRTALEAAFLQDDVRAALTGKLEMSAPQEAAR